MSDTARGLLDNREICGAAGYDRNLADLLDLNGVLYHYDREARLHALASTSHLSPAAIKAAIWDSGFEDRGDACAFDAEAYLRGFGAAIGCNLSETEWVTALRAAITPIPEALALVRPIRNRASRSELAIVRSAAQSFQCTLISLAVSQLCDGMNS